MATTSRKDTKEQSIEDYKPLNYRIKLGAWCDRLTLPYDTVRRDYRDSVDEFGVGKVAYPPDHPWAGVEAKAFQQEKYKPIWVEEPTVEEARKQKREYLRGRKQEVTPEQQRQMATLLAKRGWHVIPPPDKPELEPYVDPNDPGDGDVPGVEFQTAV